MFKKTSPKAQLNAFSSPNSYLPERAEQFYEQIGALAQLFFKQVTLRVEEALFEPLFSKNSGRPNAPVRILVAMMVFKEASRWSDSQLFEKFRFNLLFRRSLGLNDLLPSESTYSLFRKYIVEN